MKKLVVMIVGVLLAASVANAFDKIYDLTLEEFENLQISEGGVNLNNFSLAENNAFMAKGAAKVQVSFSIRNRNNDTRAVTVMLVGMSANSILWAVDAAPMMSMVSANKTEECNGSAYVPRERSSRPRASGCAWSETSDWTRCVSGKHHHSRSPLSGQRPKETGGVPPPRFLGRTD